MRVYHTDFQVQTSASNKIEQLTEISLNQKLTNLSQALVTTFKNAGASVVHQLTRPNEVRVWQVSDRQGEICWKAYDPYSNATSYLSSENDLRVWLEQRYAK